MTWTTLTGILALNTVAMRNAELTSGIEVYSDETGEVYGSSQAAAKEAIGLTVISRVVIAAGCLLAPPLATTMMERRKFIYGHSVNSIYGYKFRSILEKKSL